MCHSAYLDSRVELLKTFHVSGQNRTVLYLVKVVESLSKGYAEGFVHDGKEGLCQ